MSPDPHPPEDSWYRDGLRFHCDGPRCSDCCSGKWGSGRVHLSKDDIERLAKHLGCDSATFLRANARQSTRGFSLLERFNHDCVFHDPGTGCRVYEARPAQCRSYPFWPKLLAAREMWEREAQRCPGISAEDAALVPRDEIEARRRLHTPEEES